MNLAVLRHAFRQYRVRLIVVVAALTLWGILMPIIYATFGVTLRALIAQFPMIEQFSQFGGGNMFTLPGSIALGFIHPFAIALLCVLAVAFPLSSVAGERQRGTLENVLARPVSRRSFYATLLFAAALFIALAVGAVLAGATVSAAVMNVIDELDVARLPLLWVNGVLLYLAIAAIALAASVSFDRMGPAAGITLAIVLVAYFLQILGSLWPDAEPLQPYSLFHYLKADEVLTTGLPTFDVALLLVVIVVAVAYALWIFPRRDLAAPA